jgi:hypothetical protein
MINDEALISLADARHGIYSSGCTGGAGKVGAVVSSSMRAERLEATAVKPRRHDKLGESF